jgi:hypothetical protein
MDRRKRIVVASAMGLGAGVVCYVLGRYWLGIDIDFAAAVMLLSHRMLLGFVIGISALRWHWALHGLLLGLIVGIPDYHFAYMIQGSLNSGLYFFAGPIWGLMIEFFASVVFNARQVHGPRSSMVS